MVSLDLMRRSIGSIDRVLWCGYQCQGLRMLTSEGLEIESRATYGRVQARRANALKAIGDHNKHRDWISQRVLRYKPGVNIGLWVVDLH